MPKNWPDRLTVRLPDDLGTVTLEAQIDLFRVPPHMRNRIMSAADDLRSLGTESYGGATVTSTFEVKPPPTPETKPPAAPKAPATPKAKATRTPSGGPNPAEVRRANGPAIVLK